MKQQILKQLKRHFVFSLPLALGAFLLSIQDGHAQCTACPPNAVNNGTSITTAAFRVNPDGSTGAPLGAGLVGVCQKVRLQFAISYNSDTSLGVNSAFSGGQMYITNLTGTFSNNVTPAGGVPEVAPLTEIAPGGCAFPGGTNTVKSLTADFDISTHLADIVSGHIVLEAEYGPQGTIAYTCPPITNLTSASSPIQINVAPAPSCSISPPTNFVCAGGTASFTVTPSGQGPFTVSWTGPGGFTSTNSFTITITNAQAANAGVYTSTVYDTFGCPSSCTAVLIVNPNPVVTVNSASVCAGGSAQLCATVNTNVVGPVTYLWNTGDTTPCIIKSPAVTSNYTVVVTTTNGCLGTNSGTITVNPNPIVTVNSASVCAGGSAQLCATVNTNVVGPVTYLWNTGDTTPCIIKSPSVTSNYTVVVTTTNGCLGTNTGTITVNPNPIVTVNSAAVCAGGSAQLCATVNTNVVGPVTYLWNTGDTTPCITKSPSVTSNYTVVVTTTNGCLGTNSGTIKVNPNPIVTVNSASVCAGGSAQLCATVNTNVVGPVTYLWNTGDTTPCIIKSPSVTSNYTVTVTTTNGCLGTNSGTITVNPNPVVTVNSAAICAGGSAQLCATVNTNVVGPVTYLWSSGDTTACITKSPVVTSNYTVVVTTTNGCLGTNTGTIVVNPNAIVSVNSAAVCAGGSAQLCATVNTNVVGPVTYLWNTGDTTPCITKSPSVTSNYTVVVTTTNGCLGTNSGTITVNPNPVVTVNSPSVCAGGSAQLCATVNTNVVGPVTYLWNTGDTTPCITKSPSVTSNYTVVVTTTNGCLGTNTGTLTVNPNPVVTVNSAAVCAGGSAQLCATVNTNVVGPVTYQWSSGDTTPCITKSPAATTIYTVVVTTTNGCLGTNSGTITVNPNPIVTVNSASVCAGGSAQLCATVNTNVVGPVTYLWSSGDTTACIIKSPSVSSNYTVTVTTTNGCTGTNTGRITVNPNPVVTVNSAAICNGGSAQLCATVNTNVVGPVTYQWNTGDTTPCITKSPVVTSNYTVVVTTTNGCLGTNTGTIVVNPNAIVTVNSAAVCAGGAAQLCATVNTNVVGPVTYLWNTGDTTPCITKSPSVTSNYTVVVTTTNGCLGTNSGTIKVNPNPIVSVNSPSICPGGSAQLCATVNTNVVGPVTYQWSSGDTTPCITKSPAATTIYTVVVTTTNGCLGTNSGTLTVNPGVNCSIFPQVVTNCLELPCTNFTVTPLGGTPPFIIVVTGPGGLITSNTVTTSLQFTGCASNTPNTYVASITDSNGCTSTCSATQYSIECTANVGITKQVACFLGTNLVPGTLPSSPTSDEFCGTFSNSAVGVSSAAQNPAFCYTITVTNPGPVALTNVSIIDTNPAAGMGFGDLTADFPCVTPVFAVGASCSFTFKAEVGGALTNIVNITGNSAITGQTVTTNAHAVVTVFPASITCLKQFTIDGGPLTNDATLSDQNPHTIVWFVTVCDPSTNVNLGDVVVTDVTTNLGCSITLPPFSLDAGNCMTFPLCTNPVVATNGSFVITNTISVTADEFTVGTNHMPVCAHDITGSNIVVSSECEAMLTVKAPGACRVTGGGRQDAPNVFPANVRYITHGGQVGAPVGDRICVVTSQFPIGNPCIHGRWTHVRHMQGGLEGNFHARFYDTLQCACLDTTLTPAVAFLSGVDGATAQTYTNLMYGPGTTVDAVCNPGNRIAGPEPSPAPANKIVFTGVGDYALTQGNRVPVSVLFRVDIEDRGEPGNSHAIGSGSGGSKNGRIPDRNRTRIWILTPTELDELRGAGTDPLLLNFRNAISACNGIDVQDGATVPNGTAAFGVRAPDIDDGGELTHGNYQIHPSIMSCDPNNPTGPGLAKP